MRRNRAGMTSTRTRRVCLTRSFDDPQPSQTRASGSGSLSWVARSTSPTRRSRLRFLRLGGASWDTLGPSVRAPPHHACEALSEALVLLGQLLHELEHRFDDLVTTVGHEQLLELFAEAVEIYGHGCVHAV